MAQRQYDLLRGKYQKADVTEAAGGSIGTSAVRVTIDDANCGTKAEAITLLRMIENYINTDTWPPA